MARGVREEALRLLLIVALVDGIFIGIYFLARLRDASDVAKIVFTVVWTVVTLAVVIRGLSRIRMARVHRKPR